MESHYIQVRVYYSEKNQTRISQEKRHVGRVQESTNTIVFSQWTRGQCYLWQQCVTCMNTANYRSFCKPWCPDLLQELSHKDITDHSHGHLSFQPLWRLSWYLWPKDPTICPMVRNYLEGAQGPQVKKDTLQRQDIPGSYLSGAKGKSQTFFGVRLIFTTQSPHTSCHLTD